MSDDKLKSTDEKPTSRKSRQPAKRKTTGTTKAGSATKKVAATKVSKETPEKTPETTLEKKATASSKEKAVSSVKSADKDVTASPVKTEEKKNDLKADSADKKQIPTAQGSSKIRTFTKMAAFAAILFFAVLFVYLYAQDVQVAKEKAPARPLAATESPNLNASSPYGMRVEQLKEIEELLAVMDINTGAIDGKIDHETVGAISQFQEMSGLTVDGQPSPALLEELKAVNTLLNSQ